jgi:hypothetical protein
VIGADVCRQILRRAVAFDARGGGGLCGRLRRGLRCLGGSEGRQADDEGRVGASGCKSMSDEKLVSTFFLEKQEALKKIPNFAIVSATRVSPEHAPQLLLGAAHLGEAFRLFRRGGRRLFERLGRLLPRHCADRDRRRRCVVRVRPGEHAHRVCSVGHDDGGSATNRTNNKYRVETMKSHLI